MQAVEGTLYSPGIADQAYVYQNSEAFLEKNDIQILPDVGASTVTSGYGVQTVSSFLQLKYLHLDIFGN